MNTIPTSRATPPGSLRRSATSPPPQKTISSARSALASVRAPNSQSTVVSQRSSTKAAPSIPANQDSRESLTILLKHETAKKEQLLVQVQNKDQTIANLTAENDNIMSALNLAESRLNDLYTDQARMEEEMAARIEVNEKLRAQVKELEREKRDLQKRYNEQASTFEAERQAFYDNEQHLRSRIQSLTQARKLVEQSRSADTVHILDSSPPKNDTDVDMEVSDPAVPMNTQQQHICTKQDLNDPESEPAEMTALKLELSTLSTSYASLQSTLILLQMQLVDLKRVNDQLQEDNESYMILLREKTLSGQFDLLRQVGGPTSATDGGYNDDEVAVDDNADEVGSLRSTGMLDRVEEEITENDDLDHTIERHGADSPSSHRHHGRHGRRNDSPSRAPCGESLADLPITGPGLDLAAELGRAENKVILTGNSVDGDRSPFNGKGSRIKGSTDPRKVSSSGMPDSNADLEALRSEVKTLKDANKALSLYASKIIDRIIAEEGFEHVLAADYEKSPTTHSIPDKPLTPALITTVSAPVKTSSKLRPQSTLFSRTPSDSAVTPVCEKTPSLSPPISDTSATNKSQRRSMSFDWKNFSMFGGGEKKSETANLRPLTLKPSSTPMTSARKLETYEDEEDRRERERLHATMKLMGIEQPAPLPLPAHAVPMQKSSSNPETDSLLTATASRFSIFRSRSTTGYSDTSSVNSGPSIHNNHQSMCGLGITSNGPSGLTQEALEQAEAENSMAALDAHEQTLSEEIAKGRSGGFTELSQRDLGEEWRSRRSRRSGGGSGSTVWSAGMSRAGDEPDT